MLYAPAILLHILSSNGSAIFRCTLPLSSYAPAMRRPVLAYARHLHGRYILLRPRHRSYHAPQY
eukprot:342133-Rhodomonas_salina.2